MKKQILFLLMTVLSLSCYAQITFDKGYYIDNNNQKVECFIKNVQWRSSPFKFEYKLTEDGNSEKATIATVKEFGIYNDFKYIRMIVDMDRSNNNINDLTYSKEPVFEKEELYLKVLVEGEYTLYQYSERNLKRYFYNKENEEIKQLIFKVYRDSEGKIQENNEYKRQLFADLKCPDFKMSKFAKLKYRKDDLTDYFVEYNNCNNLEFFNFEKKKKRDLINLTIRPRLNNATLLLEKPSSHSSINVKFENKISASLGLEAEFIFPFNRNKWSLIVESAFQQFNSDQDFYLENSYEKNITAKFKYTSIEATFGIRHYMFLNENSKFFVNAIYGFDVYSKSSIDFTINGTPYNLEVEALGNLGAGVGYKQNDKYSVELRYLVNRNVLGNDTWSSEYRTLSLIFGYTFL
ncbi:porin family protein [Aureivirga marina]|uniref:tRNA modification GTPase n=1 Tax=Aureivirga marina TaxID=1182451 RepID=UPI0018C90F2F|nr:tRNA modification GTPase [Aureivirga marina]